MASGSVTRLSPERITARELWAIAALGALAAILRFSTLDLQSLGEDELYTSWLVRMDLTHMLRTIPRTESTPPLYFMTEWVWSRLFGAGEVGLRSLSALAGTATVPVAWLASRRLLSPRAALVSAALVAVNPLLVWYSGEARSYAMLALLGALSLLFFLRALENPTGHELGLWALFSALAIATHYFAGFLVAAEAGWLLAKVCPRRLILLASALPVAAGAGLLPLALHQRSPGNPGNPAHIATDASLPVRIAQIPKNLLTGFSNPVEVPFAAAAGVLVLVGVWFLISRGSAKELRAAGLAAALAAFTIGVPILLALVGEDYVQSPKVLLALVPCVIAISPGFAVSRWGLAAGLVLCVLMTGVVASVALDPGSQRPDWRGAAQALGPGRSARAIVVTPSIDSRVLIYLRGAQGMPSTGAAIGEIDVLATATRGQFSVGRPHPPRSPSPPRSLPGFLLVEHHETSTYTMLRLRASSPRRVTPRALSTLALDSDRGFAVLLQRRPG